MGAKETSVFETAKQLGLSVEDVNHITSQLGREPSLTELAMFSVEWSEHCSYRRSRRYFSKFPRTGQVPVLVGDDAGGIIIDDLAVLFKVESHNHPSQVEPKHGAATGVGGIIRDILSSGIRPIALLNSLRFGPLSLPANRRLLRGVVDGIEWYGNAIGVPTVGGEADFHPSYSDNCLVNVMCVGIGPKDDLLTSKAKPDCAVMVLGSHTGRDGIGGCSVLASQEMCESLSKRPTVQVGDPYFGKCLIEAVLEAASQKLFVALKDMGAAGLTCTTSEMSAAGGCGMEIDVHKVPAREKGMEAWEFMMSESQERMLAVVKFEHVERVKEIFHRWGLEAAAVGKTIPENVISIFQQSKLRASLTTQSLVEPPPIFPELKAPDTKQKADSSRALFPRNDMSKLVKEFLAHPSLLSKQWIYRQFDHMVQTNTVVGPGADAAVLRVKQKTWGLAVTMEGNGRYVKANPSLGAQYIVAEAARNLVAVGAQPLALTDGLNFGNPDKPDAYGEFVAAIEGLEIACHQLNLPVVSGNVSFYNEGERQRILPTPIVGMVGKVRDINHITPIGFQKEGDFIYLLGPPSANLSGSLFLEFLNPDTENFTSQLPPLDWDVEKKMQAECLALHEKKWLVSCHDVGQGGLIAALAECMIPRGLGVALKEWKGPMEEWFSESPSRLLVSVSPKQAKKSEARLSAHQIPFQKIGEVKGKNLSLSPHLEIPVTELIEIHTQTLPALMKA